MTDAPLTQAAADAAWRDLRAAQQAFFDGFRLCTGTPPDFGAMAAAADGIASACRRLEPAPLEQLAAAMGVRLRRFADDVDAGRVTIRPGLEIGGMFLDVLPLEISVAGAGEGFSAEAIETGLARCGWRWNQSFAVWRRPTWLDAGALRFCWADGTPAPELPQSDGSAP